MAAVVVMVMVVVVMEVEERGVKVEDLTEWREAGPYEAKTVTSDATL